MRQGWPSVIHSIVLQCELYCSQREAFSDLESSNTCAGHSHTVKSGIMYFMLYTLFCTLHNVHFILYTLYCTLYTVHFVLYTTHCSLHTIHFFLYTLYCTLHTVYCKLYNLYCRLYCLARPWSMPRYPVVGRRPGKKELCDSEREMDLSTVLLRFLQSDYVDSGWEGSETVVTVSWF